MKKSLQAKIVPLVLCAAVLGAASSPARADLTVTTKLGSSTRITTQLNGSIGEAIIDGLQLAANVISMIRGIASGDAFSAISGAIGAYNEALQLGGSAGDKSASGYATVVLDPNTTLITRDPQEGTVLLRTFQSPFGRTFGSIPEMLMPGLELMVRRVSV